MSKLGLAAFTLASILVACGSDAPTENSAPPDGTGENAPSGEGEHGAPNEVIVQLGDDLPSAARDRVTHYVKTLAPHAKVVPANEALDKIGSGSLVIAAGATWAASTLVPKADVDALAPEGFVLVSTALGKGTAIVTTGKPNTKLVHSNIGAAFGAFALLEELGMGFLHPLAPTTPKTMNAIAPGIARKEEPRWPIRGLQLHTMHPLELTHLLNGWGPKGTNDATGWEQMLPEWDRFLEWMLANGQNRVHWLLLEAKTWEEFASSETRRTRLKRLVDRAHDFGIAVGVDVPIVLQQQHTWMLVKKQGELPQELEQLRSRVDWLMNAGFDYLATENGTTEFTHPEPQRMLAWMNELAKHLDEKHGHRPAYVKIHCSTGQTAAGYPDPGTGEPINFNFLPHFADARMGIMPHTVQHYGLDDPAPTYGNTDFAYVKDFLESEVGRREVLWHPETAYWVSFDVDVPLFLPIYAERRLHDLRLLGADEEAKKMGRGAHAGKHMDGQSTFSSGWEWGYWLNDVVTARAAWNPHLEAKTDAEALGIVLDQALRPLGATAKPTRELIIATAKAEHDLLILGKVNGKSPSVVERRNGQAYLQGVETWDDIQDVGASIPGFEAAQMTQPDKLGLVEMRTPNPLSSRPKYTGEIELLLAAMENDLAALDAKWAALRKDVPEAARDLFDDLADAMHITWLRAKQVHGLYDYVDMRNDLNPAPRLARLAAARAALDEATDVVKNREPRYRVPADRIAGWGENPTAYRFGYLWTVRSLFFFWRDEGKAVDAPSNPCYLNIINPADIALGEGNVTSGTRVLRQLIDNPNGTDWSECAAEPKLAPTFPQYGLRTRP